MKRLTGLTLALIRAGRGRTFPALLLIVAAGLLYFTEQTPLLSIREAQFDQYQRTMPRLRESEPVIVVGIDSQSLYQ